jgi:hypothetical protein
MSHSPSSQVVSAIESGVAEITRRMEVYENDAATPWYASADDDPNVNRLVNGSITVDYNSDERRKGDLTILNDDFAFRLNPIGGFYYDKVIKLYRGVRFPIKAIKPKILLFENDRDDLLVRHLRFLAQAAGVTVDYVVGAAVNYEDIEDYDTLITIGFDYPGAIANYKLLQQAFADGKNVLSIGTLNTATQVPHIATTVNVGAVDWGLANYTTSDHPFRNKFPADGGSQGAANGEKVTVLTSKGIKLALDRLDSTSIIASMSYSNNDSVWIDYHASSLVNQTESNLVVIGAMLEYMWTQNQTYRIWEAQLGEFLIDGVNDQLFPNQLKVTIRDNTKKLLKDKLTETSTFVAGTPLRTFVRAIASNGGITKFREAIGEEVFPNAVTHDRKTERWKMIKDACTAFDYEVYFDNEGYLTVRKFLDPTTSPISHTFGTGADGNLVTYNRSINDGRIYNIARVYGDPINNDRLPYFGEAINDDPSSPTSTVKIGKRPWEFEGNFFTSDQQCLDLARSRLKILALESYDINFSSIYYPWLEVGSIVEILDPHRNSTDPTRFLLDQITYPIDLGPMSGTGKRVTLVGNRG